MELLRTKRCVLRTPSLDDRDAYEDIRNSQFVLEFNPMPVLNGRQVENEIQMFINKETVYFIELIDTKQCIGMVSISPDSIRYDANSVEISYFLGHEYSRQGYMYEVLSSLIDYLFKYKNLDLITSRVFASNVASLNLLKKCKFRQDGRIRKCVRCQGILHDDILHSILKEEFYGEINND